MTWNHLEILSDMSVFYPKKPISGVMIADLDGNHEYICQINVDMWKDIEVYNTGSAHKVQLQRTALPSAGRSFPCNALSYGGCSLFVWPLESMFCVPFSFV